MHDEGVLNTESEGTSMDSKKRSKCELFSSLILVRNPADMVLPTLRTVDPDERLLDIGSLLRNTEETTEGYERLHTDILMMTEQMAST